MRRRNVPCSPCSGGSSSGDCCGLKEKLRILWDRTIGSILRINGISPDGDGDFTIEAGSNIAITERGTGNGLRIDTTGGVSYYSAGDTYIDVDNNDLKISLVDPGQSGGVALQDDLDIVAGALNNVLDGTAPVPKATDAVNAQYLGSSSANEGTDTKPIKMVNGQAVAVTNDLVSTSGNQTIDGYKNFKLPVNISSITTGDDKTLQLSRQADTNNDIGRITVWAQNSSTDTAELRIAYNRSDGTARLYLFKVVNGVASQKVIDTL